jgi:hypothetical protein
MTRLRLYYFPQVTGRTLGGASLRSLVLDQCGLTNEGFVSLIKVRRPHTRPHAECIRSPVCVCVCAPGVAAAARHRDQRGWRFGYGPSTRA